MQSTGNQPGAFLSECGIDQIIGGIHPFLDIFFCGKSSLKSFILAHLSDKQRAAYFQIYLKISGSDHNRFYISTLYERVVPSFFFFYIIKSVNSESRKEVFPWEFFHGRKKKTRLPLTLYGRRIHCLNRKGHKESLLSMSLCAIYTMNCRLLKKEAADFLKRIQISIMKFLTVWFAC